MILREVDGYRLRSNQTDLTRTLLSIPGWSFWSALKSQVISEISKGSLRLFQQAQTNFLHSKESAHITSHSIEVRLPKCRILMCTSGRLAFKPTYKVVFPLVFSQADCAIVHFLRIQSQLFWLCYYEWEYFKVSYPDVWHRESAIQWSHWVAAIDIT